VSNYSKGRLREYRAQRILEAAGYTTTRAAGSKGAADLIAWDTQRIRFISVKSGGAYASAVEREALELLPVPPNASKEIWRMPARCREPLIEVL
jgi:Holliday junction resolvase-like predicted endonuclease